MPTAFAAGVESAVTGAARQRVSVTSSGLICANGSRSSHRDAHRDLRAVARRHRSTSGNARRVSRSRSRCGATPRLDAGRRRPAATSRRVERRERRGRERVPRRHRDRGGGRRGCGDELAAGSRSELEAIDATRTTTRPTRALRSLRPPRGCAELRLREPGEQRCQRRRSSSRTPGGCRRPEDALVAVIAVAPGGRDQERELTPSTRNVRSPTRTGCGASHEVTVSPHDQADASVRRERATDLDGRSVPGV